MLMIWNKLSYTLDISNSTESNSKIIKKRWKNAVDLCAFGLNCRTNPATDNYIIITKYTRERGSMGPSGTFGRCEKID